MAYNILDTDIKYLKGVGPQRADILSKELDIHTVGDLLGYYPYKYVDRSSIYKIRDIDGNMPYVQLCGQILSMESIGEGRGKRLIAHFSDGTGVVDLVWFQGVKFASNAYKCRKPYIVFGKPGIFNARIQIAHPEIEEANDDMRPLASTTGSLFEDTGGMTATPAPKPAAMSQQANAFRPHYNTTEKMKRANVTSQTIAKLTSNMLAMLKEPLPETLPPHLVDKFKFMSYDEAVRNIHYPTSADNLRRAEARLKFEELFYVQLNILRYARQRQQKTQGIVMPQVGKHFNDFYFNHLPFQLTGAQKRVIREVQADIKSGKQMNRLLQGDVGSGKTLVALMCCLLAVDNRCQACIMAPTEILAEQHVETVRKFLGDMPLRVELLTGTVKGKARKTILADLLAGDIDILIGTHAVIEEAVQFRQLGFVVIDEQHRFGVAQRAKLWTKNEQAGGCVSAGATQGTSSGVIPLATAPHVLVMTATPIPRTLAMTLYGDLDVSVIDELPPGRKPIMTVHQFDTHRARINAMLRREIGLGRQVYIVYPLIEESDKMEGVKDLENSYEQVCRDFPEYKVSKVHGRMKPAEKEEEMQRFISGETQILVATTVIEVGVNVPNASVMVIENAERFGLSQLHQLRGRVGRGADQSYCILVTNYKISEDTRKRVQIMVDSTDGFEIAEQDLKLRGPGDLEGTQQSGVGFDLKIANVARDGQILAFARTIAQDIINGDPEMNAPENAIIWHRLNELRDTQFNWGAIS